MESAPKQAPLRLNNSTCNRLFAATLLGFVLFATLTRMEHLGLGGAGEPELWQGMRYAMVSGWIALAGVIYLARGRCAYRQSLISALSVCGLVAVVLASIWGGIVSSLGIFGSALFYTLISSLFALPWRHHIWATLWALVVLLLQIVADILVLGMLGDFRIH